MTPNDNYNKIQLNIDESLYRPKSKKGLIIGLVIFLVIAGAVLLYVYGRSNGWGHNNNTVSGQLSAVDTPYKDMLGRFEHPFASDTEGATAPIPTDPDPDPDDSAATITVIMPKDSFRAGELIMIDSEFKYDAKADAGLKNELLQIAYHTNGTYQVISTGDLLREDTITALNAMCEAFYRETGYTGYCVATDFAYCTAEDQQKWYDNAVGKYGAQIAPDIEFRGGESEHETGRAFDIRVRVGASNLLIKNADPVYNWIYKNAHKYGFVYRYPTDKALFTGVDLAGTSPHQDHFRYVGVAAATAMYENNWCFEEFLSYVKRYVSPDDAMIINCEDGTVYRMYFVPCNMYGETHIEIPASAAYSISGDNMAGFIITIEER